MRKYQGEYPNRICEVSTTQVPRTYLVKTNNGGYYFIREERPTMNADVFRYKFDRAQPMNFEQHVTAFHRVIDGYRIEFVEYPERDLTHFQSTKRLEELENRTRLQFIQDMIRQNILPRFK
jgi:hypothetical protein